METDTEIVLFLVQDFLREKEAVQLKFRCNSCQFAMTLNLHSLLYYPITQK